MGCAAEGGLEVWLVGEVVAECAVEDVAGAEGVKGGDGSDGNLKASAVVRGEDGVWASGDGGAGDAAGDEPVEDGFGIWERAAVFWRDVEALAADGDGEEGDEFSGAGLEAAGIEDEGDGSVAEGLEQGADLGKEEAVCEGDGGELATEGVGFSGPGAELAEDSLLYGGIEDGAAAVGSVDEDGAERGFVAGIVGEVEEGDALAGEFRADEGGPGAAAYGGGEEGVAAEAGVGEGGVHGGPTGGQVELPRVDFGVFFREGVEAVEGVNGGAAEEEGEGMHGWSGIHGLIVLWTFLYWGLWYPTHSR